MATSKKVYEELKWIQDDSLPPRPPVGEFPGVGETQIRKSILNRLGENIFVPLGLAATTACLALGLLEMKRGDSHRQQLFMRGRVFFQGFTLLAMVFGITLNARRRERAALIAESKPSSQPSNTVNKTKNR